MKRMVRVSTNQGEELISGLKKWLLVLFKFDKVGINIKIMIFIFHKIYLFLNN
jgi:hypothetical protein